MAEHWRLNLEALGSIPGGTTFLSFPLLFQRSSDSNGPDNLNRSLGLGEPCLSGSYAVMKLRFFRNYIFIGRRVLCTAITDEDCRNV